MQRLLSSNKPNFNSPDAKPSDTDFLSNVRRSGKLGMGSGKLRLHAKKPPRLLSNFLNFNSDPPPVLRRRRTSFRDTKPFYSKNVPPTTKPPTQQQYAQQQQQQPFLAKRKLRLHSPSVPFVSETQQKVFRKRANNCCIPTPTTMNQGDKECTHVAGFQKRRLSDLLPYNSTRNKIVQVEKKRTVSDLSSQVSFAAINSRDATVGTTEHSKHRLSGLSSPTTHLTPIPTFDETASTNSSSSNVHCNNNNSTSTTATTDDDDGDDSNDSNVPPTRNTANSSPSPPTPLSTKNPDQFIPKHKPDDLPPCVSLLTETAEDLLAATALIPEVQTTREIRRALRRTNLTSNSHMCTSTATTKTPTIRKNNVSISGAAPDMSTMSGQQPMDTVTVQETTVKHVTRVMEKRSRQIRSQITSSNLPQPASISVSPHNTMQSLSSSVIDTQNNAANNTVHDATKLTTPVYDSGITTTTHMPDYPNTSVDHPRIIEKPPKHSRSSTIVAKLPSFKLKLGKRSNRTNILSRSIDVPTTVIHQSPLNFEAQLHQTKDFMRTAVVDTDDHIASCEQGIRVKDTKMNRFIERELTHEQIVAMLDEASNVESLVKLLRLQSESLAVTSGALKKLAKIVGDAETKEAIWLCGGIDAIIMTMGRYADVGRVQVDGAEILAKSVSAHTENKNALVSDFGLDAVISGMRGFPCDGQVQAWSCRALHNVAIGNCKFKELIGKKGGVSAAIEALASHGVGGEVVQESATLLHTLVCGVAKNVERLSNSRNWAAVLLDVLGANANSMQDNVQSKLLDILAQGSKVHLMGVGDGALTAALSAMSRNVERKEVLSVGAAAARALVEDRASGMDKALSPTGAVASLLDMLQCSVATVSGLKAT